METMKISCEIACDRTGLRVRAAVDDQVFFDGDPNGQNQVQAMVSDIDGDHELIFTLYDKSAEHTKIDDQGAIIDDVVVTIRNLAFDGIELGHVLTEHAVYSHDFNGTRETVTARFYGSMGCNGTVSFKFTTPAYLWLLEHM